MFKYPHGDLHGLNLDWFLEEWKKFVNRFTSMFTASVTQIGVNDPPTVTVTYDDNTEIYNFDFGLPDQIRPINTIITYQASASPSVIPTGTWTGTPPVVPEGQYLWTRNRIEYNNGFNVTFYSVAKQGISASPVIALTFIVPAGSTHTVTNPNITADSQVIEYNLSTPEAVDGDITVTTASGSVTVAGTFNSATTMYLFLTNTVT